MALLDGVTTLWSESEVRLFKCFVSWEKENDRWWDVRACIEIVYIVSEYLEILFQF